MKLILERAAYVNGTNTEDYSALTAAAERNISMETVRLLLNAGADRNLKTVKGESP
jgi:ankyrin repeat protein